ncbi:MAG: hypothetical protein IAI48_11385 [Candidatus Eremiobacteraeota bacterium]|nr:hypothetical protein [Candidatus Eremiobacteraeota bacterium]
MHSSSGFAMLAIFIAAAALMYLRLVPALLAVPAMALGIAAVAGAGAAGLESTIADGTVKLAPVIVTVIFGALLSRVTLSTGIAETIVTYAAEFGGDRPAVLALALCAAVAVLFTSLTGLGAIIMVGSIVLPIMMTIGVPRKTAATLFLLAFALGFIFNIAQWTFYTKTFGVERAQMQPYAFVLAAIDVVALLAFAAVRFRATRGYATWAIAADEPLARKRAPWYALATPLLPIVLYFAAGISPIVAFALAAAYGALTTAPRKAVATLVAAAIRGTEDVAPAVLLFMGIGMLLVATGLPAVRAALEPLVAAIAPRSWLGYVVLFGLFSPLALYRGPLNPFGVGIAVYTVLAGLGALPAVTLVAAIMAVVQVQNVCDPTNTQNVWVANFTGVGTGEITKLTLPFQIGVATLATVAVVLFGSGLLGAQPFRIGSVASAETIAVVAEPQAGLFAPAAANGAVAVLAGETDDASEAAAHQIRSRIAHDGALRVADAVDADPGATDCARKTYAAIVRVTATSRDVALVLSDCADWPVDEWYVPRTSDVRADALAAFVRLQTWRAERPELAEHLFGRGLAYRAGPQTPSFFYTLFKTSDGQMRAFVRAGGGAYDAGMHTNDIVEKLDGRDWWEYGTFQTQARAYDGLPHRFVVKRGDREIPIALAHAFAP